MRLFRFFQHRAKSTKSQLQKLMILALGRRYYTICHFLTFGLIDSGKNIVKRGVERRLLRRPSDEADVPFRQCLLHLLRLKPIRAITCHKACLHEGAGYQALVRMRAIALARASGLTYLHTPFSQVGHADRPMPEWAGAWEATFNLGIGEQSMTAHHASVLDFSHNPDFIANFLGFEDLTPQLEMTIPEFRQKYQLNKVAKKNQILTVCVHVRRGDIAADRLEMWTDTEIVAKTLGAVRRILNAQGIEHRICILSQGNPADLAELDGPGTQFLLDKDPMWTLREAIEADILIMAKSSFSYVAGLLSEGIKIYEPCQYPALRGWLRHGPDVDFDVAAFESQLMRLVEAENDPRASQP